MKRIKKNHALNSKGFAITTLIYGLSILGVMLITMVMATLSTSRFNTKTMAESIEDDLNNYSKTSVVFNASSDIQMYTTPDSESGWYRIQLWGSEGEDSDNNTVRGSYTTGIIYLEEGENLFLSIGSSGNSSCIYLDSANTDTLIMSAKGGVTGDSFIAGYISSIEQDNTKIVYYDIDGDGEDDKNYFYDGMMISNTKEGDGFAKIDRIVRKNDDVTSLPRQNEKLNDVTKIEATSDNATTTTIFAIANGSIVKGEEVQSGKSATLTIPVATDLDEIVVWHEETDGNVVNDQISVNGEIVKGVSSNTIYSVIETSNGVHISAYQPDYTSSKISSGNYYIFSVQKDAAATVLTANDTTDTLSQSLKFKYLNGSNSQVWSIGPIDCKLYSSSSGVNKNDCSKNPEDVNENLIEYSIEDTVNFNALRIILDENKAKNEVASDTPLNELTRNDPQIWKIKSLGNGTYMIQSSAPEFVSSKTVIGLTRRKSSDWDSNEYMLSIASTESTAYDGFDNARFYFYKLDF